MTQQHGTALITGASSGLGAEYARQLAARGHDLILVARREDRLKALAEELEAAHNISAEIITADLVQDADVARVVERIKAEPSLEILINNAGFNPFGLVIDCDFPRVMDMMTLHMQTSVRLTHAALPGLIQRGKGAIIMMSSFGSHSPMPHSSFYGASKAFLNHFAEALALELRGTGIVVQALCPGVTRTEIVDTPEFRASGFSEQSMPDWVWMEAETVVKISLSRLGRGNIIVIPGWQNKVMAVLASTRNLPVFRPLNRWFAPIMVRWMMSRAKKGK